MQLLKGEALDDRLRRQPRLPLDECLRIGRETAEALAEAHGRNLTHRDIKPGNIWLEGTSGWVKLVDFGLAHAAEDVHLTQTGAILGTPAYMSPEQARGEAVDGRSDLYSLGAVLYKLTTGDVPLRGANTMSTCWSRGTRWRSSSVIGSAPLRSTFRSTSTAPPGVRCSGTTSST
jgi:serine/threonine protein kinase